MPWNEKTNIANDNVRLVNFNFETSNGPGSVTAIVSKGITIDEAKKDLLESFEGLYQSIKIVGYEIIKIFDDHNNN